MMPVDVAGVCKSPINMCEKQIHAPANQADCPRVWCTPLPGTQTEAALRRATVTPQTYPSHIHSQARTEVMTVYATQQCQILIKMCKAFIPIPAVQADCLHAWCTRLPTGQDCRARTAAALWRAPVIPQPHRRHIHSHPRTEVMTVGSPTHLQLR